VGHLRLTEDLGGSSGGTLSVDFCMYGFGSPIVCIGYGIPPFVLIGMRGLVSLQTFVYLYFL
jgi:hypothetical protein